MADKYPSGKIENDRNVTNFMAELQDQEKNPVYTPIYPQDYEGRQAIINADRIVFNARQASDQGERAAYTAGGDIHLFSHNFISLSTRGSIHLNTEHPSGDGAPLPEENNANFIMINAPNIFLGMDDVDEIGEGKPKSYANEPAVLGLKNQEFMEKLIDFLKTIIDKLANENTYVAGETAGTSTPRKEVWEKLMKDINDDFNPDEDGTTIGELKELLRTVKSKHVFIKK